MAEPTEAQMSCGQALYGPPAICTCGTCEPVFILRAQDILAAGIVETWIVRGKHHGVHPDKLASAQKIADAMRAWPTKKVPD